MPIHTRLLTTVGAWQPQHSSTLNKGLVSPMNEWEVETLSYELVGGRDTIVL